MYFSIYSGLDLWTSFSCILSFMKTFIYSPYQYLTSSKVSDTFLWFFQVDGNICPKWQFCIFLSNIYISYSSPPPFLSLLHWTRTSSSMLNGSGRGYAWIVPHFNGNASSISWIKHYVCCRFLVETPFQM